MIPRSTDRPERKQVLLWLDPSVHAALTRWVVDDLRPVNMQIEYLLRDTLKQAGRPPGDAAPMHRPDHLPKSEPG